MLFDFLIEKNLNKKTFVIVAGIHGDEPAGNVAAEAFKNLPNVLIFSRINPTNKRRYHGKDLNRHFDTPENNFQDDLLSRIEKLNPFLVISLHEDNEVEGLYAYCSPHLEDQVKGALADTGFTLAKKSHQDKTEGGVITQGQQPYKGTLERALKRRNINYCTLETPSSEKFKKRVECLKKIIHTLIHV